MNGRYGKPWLQKKKTQDWLLKSWNEMFCAEAKATRIDASRCVGFARQGQTEWKRSVYGGCKKCTARNINVDGFSGEESVACLVVPCSPQRALPLAGKAGRRKKKKREMCAWASSVEAVTFCLRPWKAFSWLSKLNNELQQTHFLHSTFWKKKNIFAAWLTAAESVILSVRVDGEDRTGQHTWASPPPVDVWRSSRDGCRNREGPAWVEVRMCPGERQNVAYHWKYIDASPRFLLNK